MHSPIVDLTAVLLAVGVALPLVAAAALLFPWRKGVRMTRTKARPVEVGIDVKIFAGPHAGLAGEVREVFMDPDNGRMCCAVRLQNESVVFPERDDLEPV